MASAYRSSGRANEQDRSARRRSSGREPQRRLPAPQSRQTPFLRSLFEQHAKKWDISLVTITLILLGFGLVAVLTSSYPKAISGGLSSFHYFFKQLSMAAGGIVVMWAVSCVDYHRYKNWAILLYLLTLVLLVLVLTPLGTTINNATRWLFGFQPSEVGKLAIILLFSMMASNRPKSVHSIKSLGAYVLLLGMYILLLAFEPHMSAAMILVVMAFAILFTAGMRIWFLIPTGIIGSIIAVAAYFTMPHIQTRIHAFLDPFSVASGKGWQAVQSLIAIGSGGAFGLGLGQSRQKFLYLPEPFNDFIFSVVCEELGFIGAALLLVLFAYFIYRGFSIALRAQDLFGSLIAVGITTQFAFQILLNLAVVSGLFPVTGASLPLFSYGGTALIMQLMEIGILLNISRSIPPSRRD